MKTNQTTAFFVSLNILAVLYFVGRPAFQDTVPVLRARQIELVDSKGTVRASLVTEESGETVLRLRVEDGTIRVKIGASREGSGLLLLDDATNPGIHALAKTSGTGLTLVNKDGRQKKIEP